MQPAAVLDASAKTRTARKPGRETRRDDRMTTIQAAALAILLGWAQFAGATGGSVDSNGCHHSKTHGYHCHPERAKGAAGGGVWSPSTDKDQDARDKRLKRECKGRPNAGACLGYAS